MDSSIAFDPRPDLAEDSWVWDYLLKHMPDDRTQLLFHAIRCAGFTIKKENKGVVLKPTIEPEIGFVTQEEYEEFRKKWMKPDANIITPMLDKVQQTFKFDSQGRIIAS